MNSRRLQIPDPGNRMAVCARCVKVLKKEARRPLVALAAPTGYGKTTVMSAWARAVPAGSTAVWLTLTKEDNDLSRLLTHFLSAMPADRRGEREHLSGRWKGEAPRDSDSTWQTLLEPVNRVLDAMGEVYLFFDRYEVIHSETVHRLFENWLVQAGRQVHFCIASREKLPWFSSVRHLQPGPLLLNPEHLKLTAAEMQAYIQQRTGVRLQADALSRLDRTTEGWPLAVDVYASLLEESSEQAFDANAAIAGVYSRMQDVFLEDILQRQPERLQRFMLRSSIAACFDTELGRLLTDDDAAPASYEPLLRQHLLTDPDAGGQYRYHPLLARFLQTRFKQGDQAGYIAGQERLLVWLLERGRVVEAARHALHLHDYDRATSMLLSDAAAAFSCSRESILHVLEQFPGPEIIRRPPIAMLYAWFLTAEHRIAAAETVLDQTEAHMTEPWYAFPPTGENLRGYMASIRSRIHFLRRDTEKGMAYMKETEALLNGPGYLYSHFNTIDPNGSSLLKSDAGHWGAVRQTIAMCEYAEPAWKGVNQGYGLVHALLGECYLEQNRLELAEASLHRSRKIGLDLMDTGLILPTSLSLVQLKLARGEYQAAQILLNETRKLVAEPCGPSGQAVLAACQARLDMKANRPDAVRHWLHLQPASAAIVPDMHGMYDYLTLLRACLMLGQTRPGIELGERLLHYSESWYLHYHIAELYLLLAVLYDRAGEKTMALRKLEHALEIGQREEYLQLFLADWEVVELVVRKYDKHRRLNKTSSRAFSFCKELLEKISEQELEADRLQYARTRLTPTEYKVLQGLIEGRSNAQISEELTIRIETVKTHCKHIYHKLQLKSRKEVARHFSEFAGKSG